MEREGTHNYYLVTPLIPWFFSDQRAKYIFQEGSKLSKLNIFPQNFCFQGFLNLLFMILKQQPLAICFLPESTKNGQNNFQSKQSQPPKQHLHLVVVLVPDIFKQQSSQQDWGFFVSSQCGKSPIRNELHKLCKKNVQSEYSQNKIQISKVQQNVQKVEIRFDEKIFFVY